jgi:hypothetical protein
MDSTADAEETMVFSAAIVFDCGVGKSHTLRLSVPRELNDTRLDPFEVQVTLFASVSCCLFCPPSRPLFFLHASLSGRSCCLEHV